MQNCGVLGHFSSVCPDAKLPAHVHAMAGTDDAPNARDASSIIIIILAQQAER
jgi:hypothetical protein